MIPRRLIMPIIYNIGTFLHAGAGEAAETRRQFHPRKKNNKNNPQITEYLHKAHCRIFGSAANRSIGEVVQSRRRPLLGPSPG